MEESKAKQCKMPESRARLSSLSVNRGYIQAVNHASSTQQAAWLRGDEHSSPTMLVLLLVSWTADPQSPGLLSLMMKTTSK
jgi:hypothetical protein